MILSFAKDIPFTAKSKRAISPEDYEIKILKICQDHGWTYKGFLLPWNKTAQNTKVLLIINGKEKTPMIQHILTGTFNGKDKCAPPKKTFQYSEEEHLKIAQEFYDAFNWDVLGCAETYCGVDTKLILRCRCHNKIYKKGDLHNNRRQGGLTCPIIRGALKSIQNGQKQVTRNKDAQRPMHFYIFRVGENFFKFGITTRKNVLQRMREHQKCTNEIITFEYSHTFDIGWMAGDLEVGIKKHIQGKRISSKIMKVGYTETLPIKKLSETLKFVKSYINLNPDEPIYFYEPSSLNVLDFITEDELDAYFKEMNEMSIEYDDELDLEPL
ncbi:hypothetical protein [Proteus columbae]|uniref:hypothetical protein n=1 Tax=Proteus columbae TaxID=1987580 RepID=UPI00288A435E|nr:hypothetical protein [Proteus columbae]